MQMTLSDRNYSPRMDRGRERRLRPHLRVFSFLVAVVLGAGPGAVAARGSLRRAVGRHEPIHLASPAEGDRERRLQGGAAYDPGKVAPPKANCTAAAGDGVTWWDDAVAAPDDDDDYYYGTNSGDGCAPTTGTATANRVPVAGANVVPAWGATSVYCATAPAAAVPAAWNDTVE